MGVSFRFVLWRKESKPALGMVLILPGLRGQTLNLSTLSVNNFFFYTFPFPSLCFECHCLGHSLSAVISLGSKLLGEFTHSVLGTHRCRKLV